MAESQNFQFTSVSSFVQVSFWNKFSKLKIEVDKLNETERPIWGFYSIVSSDWSPQVLEVDCTSFNSQPGAQNTCIPFHGKIFNKNTIEQFKDCDKTELINAQGRLFLEKVRSGAVLEQPSAINNFFILSFMDLKKYHFYYWFAFPVPHNLQVKCESNEPISALFSETQVSSMSKDYLSLDVHQKPYFLVHKHSSQISTLHSKLTHVDSTNYDEYIFAFADFTHSDNKPKPQLKNYILFLLYHCPFLAGKTVHFLRFNLTKLLSCKESIIYKLNLPEVDPISVYDNSDINNWTGWEKNEKDKFAPRFSNMRKQMDPEMKQEDSSRYLKKVPSFHLRVVYFMKTSLYEESIDLNLKLMKWSLLPNIDLEIVRNAKYLLFGCGTLGCSVARTLLGWGARNVTLVDNSTVSFSNPVRQNLYTYEDSLSNKPKAEAASDNLKKIFPSMNVRGYQLTIPMPGHAVGESNLETVSKSVEKIDQLIKDCDVVYLLTDSRESRWLPTLLGLFYNKMVLNVALGFDSYLIMRYGSRNESKAEETSPVSKGYKALPGSQLACYFCNDITAPGNSLKERTLDQQCTVTRPGLSPIAGALAVELTVSLLQHEQGAEAPAYYRLTSSVDDDMEDIISKQSILGALPHSIRGFLSSFSTVMPAIPKYNNCIACSTKVLEAYKNDGFKFLCEAFNSAKFLEDLTGVSDLVKEEHFEDVIVMDDDEDFQSYCD